MPRWCAASPRTREMTWCWCWVLEPTGRQRAVQANASPTHVRRNKKDGPRVETRGLKRGNEFHGFTGEKLNSSCFALYVQCAPSRNGQDDLIGILTPRVDYSITGNGDRRVKLHINKHMRGRTGHRAIFEMGLEEKDLALEGTGCSTTVHRHVMLGCYMREVGSIRQYEGVSNFLGLI